MISTSFLKHYFFPIIQCETQRCIAWRNASKTSSGERPPMWKWTWRCGTKNILTLPCLKPATAVHICAPTQNPYQAEKRQSYQIVPGSRTDGVHSSDRFPERTSAAHSLFQRPTPADWVEDADMRASWGSSSSVVLARWSCFLFSYISQHLSCKVDAWFGCLATGARLEDARQSWEPTCIDMFLFSNSTSSIQNYYTFWIPHQCVWISAKIGLDILLLAGFSGAMHVGSLVHSADSYELRMNYVWTT